MFFLKLFTLALFKTFNKLLSLNKKLFYRLTVEKQIGNIAGEGVTNSNKAVYKVCTIQKLCLFYIVERGIFVMF